MNESVIFNAAIKLLPEQRPGFVKAACAGNSQLEQEVDALLREHDEIGSFIGRPAVLASPTESAHRPTASPGAQIGHYKLLEQIGEGGMGIVYVAEQIEPVRRRVALKIIKPGMDTRQVIARFEAERQALAMMDHPNIAKILDAGTTGVGTRGQEPVTNSPLVPGSCLLAPSASRPYFVMELVRGMPITEYCDKARLSPRQRLELFVDVCQAVQHAHQNGIIHRDLKPSNVLITLHDGVPVVKVIDFGVAKAVGQQLTDRTVYTALTQLVGTPLYMSPEQAEMSGLDVDTRSDVYSLGVLLYELLTGQTPFDKETLAKVGLDEMRRIIREDEPLRPSHRVSTLNAEASSTISQRRGLDERHLGRVLRGELDWIVMKSLEKDRTRRYESASSLAADIQRYLSDEPVLACPPTTMYRFQKFARKHKPALATAAAIALCLLLGTTVSAWQAARATTAEAQSNANEQKAVDNEQKAKASADVAQEKEQEAIKQRDEVKALADQLAANEKELQRTLYAAHMNLAHNAWHAGGVGYVVGMLEQHRPKPGETDLRGFEWHYLDRLCHAEVLALKHPGAVHSVAYSPDGKRLASVGVELKVWDTQSGQELLNIKGGTRSVAFSPDGKRLAAYTNNQRVKVWDSETGQELLSVVGGPGSLMSTVVFSPDGKRLAASGTVWDALTGKKELFPSSRGISGIVFSPDGKRLAKGGWNAVRVCDAENGQELLTIKHSGTTLAFSPDGKRLAGGTRTYGESGEAGDTKVWDSKTGQELLTLKGSTREGISSLVYSPDGKRVAGGSWDQMIRVWDADTGRLLATLKGHTHLVDTVAFSPDGKRLASASGDKTVKIWQTESLTSPEAQTFKGGNDRVWSVAYSPDGKRLASASLDGRKIKVWDAQTGRDLLEFEGHTSEYEGVLGLAFSPDGKRLATAGHDNWVKVFDAQVGKELLTLKGNNDSRRFLGVAFSPDGKRLASASHDPNVTIWATETGQPILKLTGLSKRAEGDVWPARRIAFSPDGSRVASGFEGQAMVWDAQTGKQLLTLKFEAGKGAKQMGVAFSPDGKLLATGGNGEILLRDVQTGNVMLTLKGHTNIVPSVVFSPDGRRLASGSHDGTVKLWDTQSGQDTLTLTGHADKVQNLAFSPDGYRLASNGPDGTVMIYDATPLPEKP